MHGSFVRYLFPFSGLLGRKQELDGLRFVHEMRRQIVMQITSRYAGKVTE